MYREDFILEGTKNHRCELMHFTGITELVDTVTKGFETNEWSTAESHSETPLWHFGSLGTAQASAECLLYSRPPQHVVAKAEAFRERLMNSDSYRLASENAKSTKRRRVFELDGGELDIDRYLGQQDECWGRVTPGLQRPVLRLAISGTASAGNDESAFAGVAALATCCAILAEQAGCALEILGTITIHNLTSTVKEGGVVLPLKHADEPFYPNALLCFGIPAVLRYYGFACDVNLLTGKIDANHGQAYPMSAELRKHLNVQHVLEVAWKDGQQQMFLDEFVQTMHNA